MLLRRRGKETRVATPEQVSVWVGLDVGKESHFADVLDNDGERLFARAVSNDQGDLESLLDRAAKHGVPGLVIDQPGSIAQLVLAVAARRSIEILKSDRALRARLVENVRFVKSILLGRGFPVADTPAPIIAITPKNPEPVK